MNTIPHIAIEYDNGVSGHFSGIYLDPEGFWVEFSLRKGLDGSDLVILRQQVWDEDHELPLDKVLSIARRDLANNLELLAEDIRSGKVIDRDTDDAYTDDEIVDGEEKDG